MRSTGCCSPIARSARATGRCSSAWSSTGRPASAAGRCCSRTSARPRASARAGRATTASGSPPRVAAAERERDAEAEHDEGAADAAPAASLPERGELVSVPRYGRGIVDAVDAEGVTVVFPEGSRRVFLPAFVRRRALARRGPRRREKLTASAA